jgi:hypothetical protein
MEKSFRETRRQALKRFSETKSDETDIIQKKAETLVGLRAFKLVEIPISEVMHACAAYE